MGQWFDLTKKIDKWEADLTEAQMALSAVKQNLNPDCLEAKKQYRKMRKAVREHNKKFDK